MTHLVKSLLNRNLLALVAFAAALAPQALKANEAKCPLGNATPHGTYVLTVDGTGTIVGVGGLTAVGEVTYDGNGHENAQYTASVNGTIYKGVAVTGVYTVNPRLHRVHNRIRRLALRCRVRSGWEYGLLDSDRYWVCHQRD